MGDTWFKGFFIIYDYNFIFYRIYSDNFRGKSKTYFQFLSSPLNELDTDDFTVDIFKMAFLNILNKLAPLTKKYLRANHSRFVNPLSAKFIKWSNTLKQIVGKLPTNCLSVFDHFSGFAFKGLIRNLIRQSCKDQGLAMNILKIKLDQLG